MVGGSRCVVVVGLGSVERGTDVVEGEGGGAGVGVVEGEGGGAGAGVVEGEGGGAGAGVIEGRRRGTEGEGEATIGWVGSGEWVTNPRFWLYMNPV